MRHETRDMRHTLLAALMTLCAVTVATAAPTGVTVNGVALDSAGSGGEGWKYYLPHITLTNAGPFTISGTNKTSQVRVVVQEGVTCDVTLSNLVIEALGSSGQCAFTLQTNACVALFLAGNNSLLSGERCAGLAVAGGRTLSITNAPGDDAGALTATGGKYAAGIGGNTNWRYLAENVGWARSVGEMHSLFMASPAHRASILDGRYSRVGTGVAIRNGRYYVVQVFGG